MRILDLGAHDGFVGTWLGRQMPGLHIDGVEANPDAVRIANERRNGNGGEYVQGLAEDAFNLFDAGTYDAVVAFELIEHVVDVDDFLTVCELMCTQGTGRVYLSTPNGTFGEGQNPHHLRAYRAIDLFEVCRRRGSVEDMVVGQDGVTVISYTPNDAQKPELAIYCGPGWEKWHPTDIETKGLGGSETAAIRLATALSSRYTVTVYGECDFCAYRQVTFKPHQTFDPLEEREAVIASRAPWLADRPLNAARKLLWMHDTDYGKEMTPERMDKFDSVMVLSEWHREHVLSMYDFIEDDKVVVTGNAIEPEYFDYEEVERPPVCLYSSSPDRGLDLLLDLWPKVREQIPEAELHYCYSSVYDKVAEQNPTVAAFRDRVVHLADQPGVVNLGSLTQPQVAKKMGRVRAWLAPSYHTPGDVRFHETYCIGAVEAAAAGACPVMSGWGALPERALDATNSILIPPPDDGSPLRTDEWVRSIVNAMTVPEYQRSLSALETTWDERAVEFDRVIQDGLASITR